MARIRTTVEYGVADSDHYDVEVDCVTVQCARCAHETKSFGRSGASVRRCLALLREECPRNQKNYYMCDEMDGP